MNEFFFLFSKLQRILFSIWSLKDMIRTNLVIHFYLKKISNDQFGTMRQSSKGVLHFFTQTFEFHSFKVLIFCRGQKYFNENKIGIMLSAMYGLFSLICEPNGGDLLDKTGNSSTAEDARKRYVSTVVHLFSWYSNNLEPGST